MSAAGEAAAKTLKDPAFKQQFGFNFSGEENESRKWYQFPDTRLRITTSVTVTRKTSYQI